MSILSGVCVVGGGVASRGTGNQISPTIRTIRVLMGLHPPSVALSPSYWFTCGSAASNINAPHRHQQWRNTHIHTTPA